MFYTGLGVGFFAQIFGLIFSAIVFHIFSGVLDVHAKDFAMIVPMYIGLMCLSGQTVINKPYKLFWFIFSLSGMLFIMGEPIITSYITDEIFGNFVPLIRIFIYLGTIPILAGIFACRVELPRVDWT